MSISRINFATRTMVLAAVAVFAVSSVAQGNILLRDQFIYDNPDWYDLGDLGGQWTNAGFGWKNTPGGAWDYSLRDDTTNSTFSVVEDSLTYPNLAVEDETNGAVHGISSEPAGVGPNSFVQIVRGTDPINDEAGKPMYFSTLINRSVGSDGQTAINFTVDNSEFANTGVVVGVEDSNQFVLIGKDNAGNPVSGTTGSYTNGDTALLVARLDINDTGDETLKLYVNPDPLAGEPATADVTLTGLEMWQDTGSVASTTGAVAARFAGADDSSGQEFTFDNIRIASAWENAVVAVPEPGSLALIGLGGLAMLSRRRRATQG